MNMIPAQGAPGSQVRFFQDNPQEAVELKEVALMALRLLEDVRAETLGIFDWDSNVVIPRLKRLLTK